MLISSSKMDLSYVTVKISDDQKEAAIIINGKVKRKFDITVDEKKGIVTVKNGDKELEMTVDVTCVDQHDHKSCTGVAKTYTHIINSNRVERSAFQGAQHIFEKIADTLAEPIVASRRVNKFIL